MKCSICGTEKKGDTINGGWKQKAEQIFCPSCWHKLYFVRSVTFPVASIVEGPGETAAERWKSFRAAMQACWQNSTQLANWAITEMAKRDVVRMPGMEKLPPSPPNKKTPNGEPSFYLYKEFQGHPLAVDLFKDIDTHAVVAILNNIQAKYKASRFDVIWKRDAALPTFKFPYPYPIGSKNWKAEWLSETELAPVIRVTLNKTPFAIRLRGGSGFRRQKETFAKLISGDAAACEMAIYRVRAAGNDNRIGIKAHNNGATVNYNVMVKLVMWLPKEIIKRDAKVLTVSTDKGSFLIASFGDSELWRINADHVRRWIAEYNARRHRLSEDLKAEIRTGGKDKFADLRERLARVQNDRLNSFVHESARQVSNYASRHKCSEVFLNDECRDYFPNFPWDDFRQKLREKISDENNIEFSLWSDRSEETTSDSEASPDGSEIAAKGAETTQNGKTDGRTTI